MYDYHTHSSFSDDCNIPMEEMVQTAVNKGVIMYAVTDHYDPDYPADEQFAFDLDFENYHKKQDLVPLRSHPFPRARRQMPERPA